MRAIQPVSDSPVPPADALLVDRVRTTQFLPPFPIYALRDGRRVTLVTEGTSKTPQFLHEAATTILRKGTYPLTPALQAVYDREMQASPVPFRLRSRAERWESARRIALEIDRLIQNRAQASQQSAAA